MVRFQHVANGTSTTGLIQQAGIPGALSIWADVLNEGPVPVGLTDDELLAVRARFLASPDEPSETVAEGLRRWRRVVDSEADYDELVLWYEHDLFDQLNLIQVLSRIADRPRAKRVSLVSIGSYPGRPAFKGLGELTPDELRPLLDTRQTVGHAQYGVASKAWDAFRSPDPTAIEGVLRGDTSALPFLDAALRRHLEEFPWIGDGLSRTERRLLALARESRADIWRTFPRMHDGETAYYVTDGSYWSTIESLAFSSPALIEMNLGTHARRPGQLPSGTLALSSAGRDVLDERTDRVRQGGIDRWLGGVHLQGKGPVWRWDAAKKRLVHH